MDADIHIGGNKIKIQKRHLTSARADSAKLTYAGGASPISLTCPDTNRSNSSFLCRRVTAWRAGVIEEVSVPDTVESNDPRELMRSSVPWRRCMGLPGGESVVSSVERVGFARLVAHGQLEGVSGVSSNDSEYPGREVHSGLHRH